MEKKCVLLCTTPQLHKTHRPPRVIPPARPPSKHVPSLQLDSNHQQAVATSSLVYYSDTQTPEPCIRKGASTQALWKKWHANEYTPTWTSPSAPGATQNTSSRTWSPRPRWSAYRYMVLLLCFPGDPALRRGRPAILARPSWALFGTVGFEVVLKPACFRGRTSGAASQGLQTLHH